MKLLKTSPLGTRNSFEFRIHASLECATSTACTDVNIPQLASENLWNSAQLHSAIAIEDRRGVFSVARKEGDS